MLKLLQINECLNFSTGKIAQQIGEAAMKQGWESWIAYSSREPLVPCNSKTIKVGGVLNPYIHYIANRVFDREGLASAYSTRKLVKKIKDIKPDVVHLHNIHDHWLNYKILFEYLNKTDIQVVWTFHDCWAFTGHCFHFVTKNCEKWKKCCHDCPLQHEYPNTFLDRSKKNHELKKRLFTDCKNLSIVACSDWIGSLAKESFLKEKRIQTIHNGIDLKTFVPTPSENKDSKYTILAVSNVWNKEKGWDDILRLREMLSDEYLIVIVGLSEEQVNSLPDGVVGVQRTKDVKELVKLYSDADVFINPTYADTFPTVNLEALACGTPVVTYNTGGCPESIIPETGMVVERGDIRALLKAILEVCKYGKSYYKTNCIDHAKNNFDAQMKFNEYIELYEKLIGIRGGVIYCNSIRYTLTATATLLHFNERRVA